MGAALYRTAPGDGDPAIQRRVTQKRNQDSPCRSGTAGTPESPHPASTQSCPFGQGGGPQPEGLVLPLRVERSKREPPEVRRGQRQGGHYGNQRSGSGSPGKFSHCASHGRGPEFATWRTHLENLSILPAQRSPASSGDVSPRVVTEKRRRKATPPCDSRPCLGIGHRPRDHHRGSRSVVLEGLVTPDTPARCAPGHDALNQTNFANQL